MHHEISSISILMKHKLSKWRSKIFISSIHVLMLSNFKLVKIVSFLLSISFFAVAYLLHAFFPQNNLLPIFDNVFL